MAGIRINPDITEPDSDRLVGRYLVHTYMLLHTERRQCCSVSGQPGLTTGGGSGGHHHQDKSARHLTLTLITR